MNRVAFFRQRIPEWRKNPVKFFHEVLHFEADKWQKSAAMDLAENPRVTIRSGQGVGKTAFEAACLLWFLCCFPFPKIVATAPTRQQLHDVLWSEVAKWQSKCPLLCELLKWTKTYIYMRGYEKRWFAVARTATKPENMQGFHEDNMLFIVDEASGVAEPIMEAILGTLSGPNNKLLMCGNPTKTSGAFFDSHHKDRHLYACHKINSLDSPRTDKDNIESLIRKYGRDSNFVRVRVYGEFPLQEDDVFIPLSLLDTSVKYTEPADEEVVSIDIACDVARFGDDKTVIGYKVNEKVAFHKKIQGQDLMRSAKDIAILFLTLQDRYHFKWKVPVKIDDGGLGGGVTDKLREIKTAEPEKFKMMEIFPVTFGKPIKHRYYADSTTFMMAIVRTLLSNIDDNGKEKPAELILPDDDDLIGQLSTRKYTVNERSKMIVESKKAMKARGLPSPDEADCVLLLCLPVRMKNDRRDKI